MTNAADARRAAGLTLEQAAKKARISPRYLRQVERHGANFALAELLAQIYRCEITVFLYPNPGVGGGTPTSASGRRRNRPEAQ